MKASKKLFILSMIVAGSLIANSAYSQVRIEAQFGVTERDFPGYTYYTYPSWNGHFRDRVYYEHYRPVFYREHKRYFRGRKAFDNARWERDRNRHERHGRRW